MLGPTPGTPDPPAPSHSSQGLGGYLQHDLITCFASIILILNFREIWGRGDVWKGKMMSCWWQALFFGFGGVFFFRFYLLPQLV